MRAVRHNFRRYDVGIRHYLHQRHSELAAKVAAVIREMDASGERGRMREKLIRQVLGAS